MVENMKSFLTKKNFVILGTVVSVVAIISLTILIVLQESTKNKNEAAIIDYGNHKQTVTQTDTWKVYENDIYGYQVTNTGSLFSLEVPDKSSDRYKYFSSVNSPNLADIKDDGIWITIEVLDNKEHLSVLEIAANHPGTPQKAEIKNVQEVVINGLEAVQQVEDFTNVQNTETGYSFGTYIKGGEYIYSIKSLTRNSDGFDSNSQLYNQFVYNFDLTDDSIERFVKDYKDFPEFVKVLYYTNEITNQFTGDKYMVLKDSPKETCVVNGAIVCELVVERDGKKLVIESGVFSKNVKTGRSVGNLIEFVSPEELAMGFGYFDHGGGWSSIALYDVNKDQLSTDVISFIDSQSSSSGNYMSDHYVIETKNGNLFFVNGIPDHNSKNPQINETGVFLENDGNLTKIDFNIEPPYEIDINLRATYKNPDTVIFSLNSIQYTFDFDTSLFKVLNDVDYCTASPTPTEIGRNIYPVNPYKYGKLGFLGELFTANDCGQSRTLKIFGVHEDTYTLWPDLSLVDKPSSELLNVLLEVGFEVGSTCDSGLELSECTHWSLLQTVPLEEILKLKPYASEIKSSGCVNCG